MNRLRWVIAGLLLLLCAVSAVWLYFNIEETTITVERPGSAEARANPLLAAQRYMQGMGAQVSAEKGNQRLIELPQSSDALLLYANQLPFTEERLQNLQAWVEQGGHLVMDVAQYWNPEKEQADSALLDHLGVELIATQLRKPSMASVAFEDDVSTKVAFRNRYLMHYEGERAIASISSDFGDFVLQLKLGEGKITLINDLSFLANDTIAEADHALFLYQLVGAERHLWMLFDPYRLSLAALLWKHAAELLVSVALLLILLWWAANHSLLPPRRLNHLKRQNLQQHIDALGMFDQRFGLLPQQVAANAKAIEKRWLTRFPGLQPMNRQQRAEWIAHHTGLPHQQVHQALYVEHQDDTSFIQRTAVLQLLRQSQG